MQLFGIVLSTRMPANVMLNEMRKTFTEVTLNTVLTDKQANLAQEIARNYSTNENLEVVQPLNSEVSDLTLVSTKSNSVNHESNLPNSSTQNSSSSELKMPRLLAAAKEFNIGKDTLVDYLLTLGYNEGDLKPVSRLTPEMYMHIKKKFENDKVSKAKRDLINIQISSNDQDSSTLPVSGEPSTPYLRPNDEISAQISISDNFSDNIVSNKIHMTDQAITKSPVQRILFGSPGTGKSHRIDGASNSYLTQLGISDRANDLIKTVFHPEYTYGDFMGKLLPYTNDEGQVEYRFYAGHFLQALGRAYKNIVLARKEYDRLIDEDERNFKREIGKSNKRDFTEEDNAELQRRRSAIPRPIPQNVALVIDEINRGNSAAIFGTIFQLLDREPSGWSSYQIKISDLENAELLKVISFEKREYKKRDKVDEVAYSFDEQKCTETEFDNLVQSVFDGMPEANRVSLLDRNIKLPPNLSIIGTMNTSDNSIYFMDSAFKRRWEWEFVDITSEDQRFKQQGRQLFDGSNWADFVDNLNTFIKRNGKRIRKIEDKQIGYFFIKDPIISKHAIQNKLLFFLWDSIFSNDKKPLEELLGPGKSLVTFGDFVKECDSFIYSVKAISNNGE
jgi:hypothetical protein